MLAFDQELNVLFVPLQLPQTYGIERPAWFVDRCPRVADPVVCMTGGAISPSASKHLGPVSYKHMDEHFDPRALRELTSELARAARAGEPAGARNEVSAAGTEGDGAAPRPEQDQNTQFRLGIERSTDAIFMTETDGRINYANPSFYRLYGRTPADTLGNTPRILKSGITSPEWYEQMWRTLIQKGTVSGELINRTMAGAHIQVEISNNAILDTDGTLLGFLAVHRDVTERNRAQQQFRVIFETSLDGIVTLEHPSWRLTSANPAALSMFGAVDLEDFVSRSPWAYASQIQADGRGSAESVVELLESTMRDGSTTSDWTLRRLDGVEFPATILLTRMEIAGKFLLQANVRDTTQQRRHQMELGHARKLQAVGQLAAGIAHEINTPTQFVGDGLHFLKESVDGLSRLVPRYRDAIFALGEGGSTEQIRALADAEAEVDLAFILQQAPVVVDRCLEGLSRIASIVGAMKEFARPDQGGKEPADINQALRNTLAIANAEYRYVADVETDLGPLPPVECLIGDLKQVFLNLLVNAAHAIESKERHGTMGVIRVSSRRDGDHVSIRVSDTGVGLPAEIQDRVFDPFFTTKPIGRGRGQGLAIAHSIVVDKHAGSITFETEEGQGTTFEVRLPIGGRLPTVPSSTTGEH